MSEGNIEKQNCVDKLCTKILKGEWLSDVMKVVSAPTQVVIRGELSADGEASEVLAIDDLSFSPGCLTAPGTATINNISLHRRGEFSPWHFEISPHINRLPHTCFEYW